MKHTILWLSLLLFGSLQGQNLPTIRVSQVRTIVEAHDFQEIRVNVPVPTAKNPFTDVNLSAVFTAPNGEKINVKGFCDDQAGKLFIIRFMPRQTGLYAWTLSWEQNGKTQKVSDKFSSIGSKRKGMVQIDPAYPWHFMWEGTKEHYFYNGTTCYWLLGWKDESMIRGVIDRYAKTHINRMRVSMNARQNDGSRWSEPMVKESAKFTFMLNPWIAARPLDLDDPGFDVTRFNVAHWQKIERMVAHARSKNIVVSLIFYVDGLDHGCDPFKKAKMGNEDEKRYYRYAISRLAAYSNVMWDVTNEYHLFRSEEWADKMGQFIRDEDPYDHAMSIHGHGDFPFRKANWVDFTMFQNWDECADYKKMLSYREEQAATGTPKPQVNEEYGYEGHYPAWGCGTTKVAPGRAAENRIHLAWQMYMAGCYQTTGERANDGTGAGKDTGGGWINGRGNADMILFKYHDILYETFTSLEWWKMNPAGHLINEGNLCLAEPGKQYLIYTMKPQVILQLDDQAYQGELINPRSGEKWDLGEVKGPVFTYPSDLKKFYPLDGNWAIRLVRK